jgi:hypothetical protein
VTSLVRDNFGIQKSGKPLSGIGNMFMVGAPQGESKTANSRTILDARRKLQFPVFSFNLTGELTCPISSNQ